jgi:hypothetical protein
MPTRDTPTESESGQRLPWPVLSKTTVLTRRAKCIAPSTPLDLCPPPNRWQRRAPGSERTMTRISEDLVEGRAALDSARQ